MYLLSPARTRFAFGPGNAVMILGPMRVWVDMASSEMVVVRSSLALGFEAVSTRTTALKPESDEEDGKVSRYRTSWDAPAMATLPDSGAGIPESGASTRAGANWDFGDASGIIPQLL